MKKRLLLAAVCILALPIMLSISGRDKLNNSVPFAMIALAGRTLAGDWCQCGTSGCICDPGEPGGLKAQPTSPGKQPKAKPGRGVDLDLGTGAFLIGLALFMWSRMRAS